jgi:Ti-type conjugative transfer relaxase TraA
MAIYHLSLRSKSRAEGQSAGAKYAYDMREGKYEKMKDKLVGSGSMNMPAWAENDSGLYWQAADDHERANGKLCNSIDIALPSELTDSERLELANDIAEKITHTEMGNLPCSWAIHEGSGSNPHMHIIISERINDGHERTPETWFNREAVGHRIPEKEGGTKKYRYAKSTTPEEGGAKKYRYMKSTAWLKDKRQEWERVCNEKLAECGHEARIDHRSHVDRDIHLEPQIHLGAAKYIADSDKMKEFLAIAQRNGERIVADPSEALKLLTYHNSTFSYNDIAKMANQYSADPEQYNAVLSALINNDQVVNLGENSKGQPVYTTREMLQTEQKMLSATGNLAGTGNHAVSAKTLENAIAASGLSDKQAAAARHIVDGKDVVSMIGFAGSGKSYMLNTVRAAYEAEGYKLRGAALSAVAAKSLSDGSGIQSDTIHATLYKWENGRELLQAGDIFVVDEAGMVGSRQMSSIAEHCERSGAKLVLVGDSQQLQAVEAGGAFQAIVKQTGYAELDEIRRQRQEWQQEATKQLAGSQQAEAIRAYSQAGFVHACETDDQAKQQLVDAWRQDPGNDKIMLAYRRADVADLNAIARNRRIEAGEIEAQGRTIETFKGEREFVAGDQLLFLKNDRALNVKNGTVGTIKEIDDNGTLTVHADGREVTFTPEEYNHIDHGYAMTVHKSQGATVDNSYIYASRNYDKHAGYVAMSRHRDDMQLFYSKEQFKDERELSWVFSRNNEKELATEYAEARGIETEGSYTELEQAIPVYTEQVEQEAPAIQPEAPALDDDERGKRMFELLQAGKQVYTEQPEQAPVYVEEPEKTPAQAQQPDYLNKWAEQYNINKAQAAECLYERKSVTHTQMWKSVPEDIKTTMREQVNAEYVTNQHNKVQADIDKKYDFLNDPKQLKEAATEHYNGEKLNTLREDYTKLETKQIDLVSTHDQLQEQRNGLKFYERGAKKEMDQELKTNEMEQDETKKDLSQNEKAQQELNKGVGKDKEQEFFDMQQERKGKEEENAHQKVDENHRQTIVQQSEREKYQELIKQNREEQKEKGEWQWASDKTPEMDKDQTETRKEFDKKYELEDQEKAQDKDKTQDQAPEKNQDQAKAQEQAPEKTQGEINREKYQELQQQHREEQEQPEQKQEQQQEQSNSMSR